ncbi:MAG: hypothetical protein COA42_22510 [Alteromonadaceae bacterium]|nr:MAG: hypothetical protein COA42_22510 [Alteromonadaceae bacterium]
MLIDFTVKNYRSFRDVQLLSLYADSKPRHHSGNISYDNDLGILRTCAIYGANASGKTNVIKAFEALKGIVVNSGDLKDGDRIGYYEPYMLSADTANAPCHFEVEFYVEQQRYRYQISFDSAQITYEKLDFYPASRAANLFTRDSATDWKAVKFGEHYRGGKRQIAFFANNAYLSRAGNSPDAPEVIRKVYNYFRQQTEAVTTEQNIRVVGWEDEPTYAAIVNTFLQRADFGIDKFEIEERNMESLGLPSDMPYEIKHKIRQDFSKTEVFFHRSDSGDLVKFNKDQESRGTRRLFKILPFFLTVLEQGMTLFFDELESSFHPHMAELIVKIFNDPLINKKGAQLIFTTHDLTLMAPDKMRKDQIYLVQKNARGSELDSLESFDTSLKDSSPFAKWYNEGRLGGIPKINYRDISDAIKAGILNA